MHSFLTVWVPILLSLIAIIITLCTVKSQNKIAGFDICYKSISSFNFLLQVSKEIDYANTSKAKLQKFFTQQMIGCTICAETEKEHMTLLNFYEKMISEAKKTRNLLTKKERQIYDDFLCCFEEYIHYNVCGVERNVDIERYIEDSLRFFVKQINEMSLSRKLEKYLFL